MANNNFNVLREKIKPVDCAICIGIPVSRRQYLFHQKGSAFWRKHYRDYDTYRNELVTRYKRYIKPLKTSYGVKIISNCSLGKLRRTFLRGYKLVVIFTHSESGKVELFRGLVDFATLAGAIPDEWMGVIDLYACEPPMFLDSVQDRLPHVAVSIIDRPVNSLNAFIFINLFFGVLYRADISFAEAITGITEELRAMH
jgi:hypothetical protein